MSHKTDQRKISSPKNGKKGGRPPAPPHAEACDDFKIMSSSILYHRGQWYRFLGSTSGWLELPESAVEDMVITFLRGTPRYRPYASNNYVRSIMMNLRATNACGVPHESEIPSFVTEVDGIQIATPAPNLISFNGQIIDIIEYANQYFDDPEYDPGHRIADETFFSRDYMPFEFDPLAGCSIFDAFLERVLPNPESRRQLQRFFGLSLTHITRYEVFLFMLGESARNGKSTVLNILTKLIGEHNVSTVDLSTMYDRFSLWPLATSKVNICGDMNIVRYGEMHQVEGRFKDLISGGQFEYERKGQDKYIASCRAKFVFAANQLPSFVDKSDAIWERMRIINFPIQIPYEERDPNLADKITANELPGVLQWALTGLAMVLKDNAIPETEDGADIKNKHRLKCDHEAQFVADVGYAGGLDKMPAANIYEEYRHWMQANNYKPLSSRNFVDRLLNLIPSAEYKPAKIEGKSVRCIINIAKEI